MLQNKDLSGFLQQIKNHLDLLLIINIAFHQQQYQATEISQKAEKLNIATKIIGNFTEINSFLTNTQNTVIICGSLYLAGSFLSLNL